MHLNSSLFASYIANLWITSFFHWKEQWNNVEEKKLTAKLHTKEELGERICSPRSSSADLQWRVKINPSSKEFVTLTWLLWLLISKPLVLDSNLNHKTKKTLLTNTDIAPLLSNFLLPALLCEGWKGLKPVLEHKHADERF